MKSHNMQCGKCATHNTMVAYRVLLLATGAILLIPSKESRVWSCKSSPDGLCSIHTF